MKEMRWRKVLADRSCGDPRAYRLIQARIDKTSLRSADYVKSLCSTSEFGLNRLETAECTENLVALGDVSLRDLAEAIHAEGFDIEAGDHTPLHHCLTEKLKGDLLFLGQIGIADVTTGEISRQATREAIASPRGIMNVL